MFRKFIWVFVVFPAGLVLVAFALANRHLVRLNLDPFSSENPYLAFDAPFFLFLLCALVTGLLLGGVITWFGQRGWRRAAREAAREKAVLKAQGERLEAQLSPAGDSRLDTPRAAE